MIKYKARVTSIGPFVSEFIDHNILVLFGESAPEELAEFALIHDGQTLHSPLAAGDRVSIDSHSFEILAVGEVASQNLENLGHLVLKFNGEKEVEMPGDVCVEKRPLPPIAVGTLITLEG